MNYRSNFLISFVIFLRVYKLCDYVRYVCVIRQEKKSDKNFYFQLYNDQAFYFIVRCSAKVRLLFFFCHIK